MLGTKHNVASIKVWTVYDVPPTSLCLIALIVAICFPVNSLISHPNNELLKQVFFFFYHQRPELQLLQEYISE